jgi:hypothetical protein
VAFFGGLGDRFRFVAEPVGQFVGGAEGFLEGGGEGFRGLAGLP